MERNNHLKIVSKKICRCGYLIVISAAIIVGLALPSFAWESEIESSKNLKFSVRIFSIPESMGLKNMSFSYNGNTAPNKNTRENEPVFMEEGALGRHLVESSDKQLMFNGLNSRIREFGAFLLRYIKVDGSTAGIKEARDQNISLEFQSNQSDLSGAILFTLNI
jgi:hypothetical protein